MSRSGTHDSPPHSPRPRRRYRLAHLADQSSTVARELNPRYKLNPSLEPSRMSFNHEQDRHEALIHILSRIAQGIERMANAEAQALADLQSAVTDLGAAIATEVTALQAAINAQGVNNSPAIENSVSNIRNLIGSLNTSVATPPVTAPAPDVPPTPTSIPPSTALPDPTASGSASITGSISLTSASV